VTPSEALVATDREGEGEVVTLAVKFAPHNFVVKPLLAVLIDAAEKAHRRHFARHYSKKPLQMLETASSRDAMGCDRKLREHWRRQTARIVIQGGKR
jgi:hypothetical protein